MKSRTLLFDLETSPNLGYSWGKYEQDIISFKEQWFILSFSARWLGGKTITKGLCDYEGYERNRHSDKKLVQDLWKLFDEAEILVAHNGDQFDIRKANARFTFYGLKPPSPYRKIDTLKIARKYYAFNSNRLDDLGDFLKLGRKVKHDGFNLWQKCMEGDMDAWRKMKKYNQQDVALLNLVYDKFLPWIENHPAKYFGPVINGQCLNCGGMHLNKRGTRWVRHQKVIQYFCQDCGKWQ